MIIPKSLYCDKCGDLLSQFSIFHGETSCEKCVPPSCDNIFPPNKVDNDKCFCNVCNKELIGRDNGYYDTSMEELYGLCIDCGLVRADEILHESRENYTNLTRSISDLKKIIVDGTKLYNRGNDKTVIVKRTTNNILRLDNRIISWENFRLFLIQSDYVIVL